MARILHDIRCTQCASEKKDVVIVDHVFPRCEKCDGKTTWIPAALSTDVYGHPQYSIATGLFHSSQREKEKHMSSLGYYPKGDKDHGGRVDLSIRRTAFSYPKQADRKSTGERYG